MFAIRRSGYARDRPAVGGEAGPEQHRLRSLRQGVRRGRSPAAGSVPVLPRHRVGARIPLRDGPVHPAEADARHHQEQPLHRSTTSACRASSITRRFRCAGATILGFCQLGDQPGRGAGLLRDEDAVLVQPADRRSRRSSSGCSASRRCSCSSSAFSASMSDLSTRRSEIGRWSSKRSASISTTCRRRSARTTRRPSTAALNEFGTRSTCFRTTRGHCGSGGASGSNPPHIFTAGSRVGSGGAAYRWRQARISRFGELWSRLERCCCERCGGACFSMPRATSAPSRPSGRLLPATSPIASFPPVPARSFER